MAGAGFFIPPDAVKKSLTMGLKASGGRTPAEIRRGNQYALGGALTGAGLGAGVGIASSAAFLAEAAPGLLSLGPYGAAVLAALGIADLVFGGALQGKPKLQDTVEAVARLYQSQNPEIQQLAKNLAILVRNDAPLSSGNPAIQAQIRDWIGGAVRTILGSQSSNPNAVGELDTAIRRVLTSEVAAPASSLDATIGQLTRGAPPPPQPFNAPRQPFAPSQPPPPNLPLGRRTPGGLPAPQPLPPPPQIEPIGDALHFIKQFAENHPYLNLTACIGFVAAGLEGAAIRCMEELLAAQIDKGVSDIIRSAKDYLRSLFHRQPNLPPPPQIDFNQYQYDDEHKAPLLDTKKPCPECDGVRGRITRQLDEQRDRLTRDVRVEQEQDLEQSLEEQEQELSELEQLETQPAAGRNIKQELSRKAELQQKILQEQGELASQPDAQFPDLTGNQPAPKLKEPAQKQIERQVESELEQQRKHEDIPVTFCIGCKNQEDAIMFLNGEPSACSVMPGTTQFLGGH